jgi:O-antigen ligase
MRVESTMGRDKSINHSTNIPIFVVLYFVFLLTACVGIWAAYDKSSAWIKFWIIVGGIFIFFAIALQSGKNIWLFTTILNGFITFLAIYFLLSNDWAATPADLSILNQLGSRWINIRPNFGLVPFHPNFVGGLIAIFVPFSFALAIQTGQNKYWVKFFLIIIFAVVSLIGLIFTSSRAAWLALTIAMVTSSTWFLSRNYIGSLSNKYKRILGVGLTLIGVLGLFAVTRRPDILGSMLEMLPGPNNANSRLEIYTNTFRLINDFPFTGGGLAAFPGLYSQYILNIPLFFFSYSHNLFLDIWLEQGFIGLIAFLFIYLISIALILFKGEKNLLHWATLSGFIVIILHGFFDDPLYGNLGTPLLFILPGIAVSLSLTNNTKSESFETSRRFNLGIAACFFSFLLIKIIFTMPLNSYWLSNQGAVEMAQLELSEFPTGQWNNGENITEYTHVKQLYITSLSNGHTNFTSHYRLGLIAMIEKEFYKAIYHLESAFNHTPKHRGVRKSLGYCYVWTGQFKQAEDILSDFPEVETELSEYIYWWQSQGRQDLSKKSALMIEYLRKE